MTNFNIWPAPSEGSGQHQNGVKVQLAIPKL